MGLGYALSIKRKPALAYKEIVVENGAAMLDGGQKKGNGACIQSSAKRWWFALVPGQIFEHTPGG